MPAAEAQHHPVYPTAPTPPHTSQEVILLFAGNTADERVLLTLNNNRPQPLSTSITVYTATGRAFLLADISMVAQESKIVELSPILKAAGLGKQVLGWISLEYSGVRLEMGAQMTLYPAANGIGLDSPRSLSSDYKSNKRNTVFWVPKNGVVRLSLTNRSDSGISVVLSCDVIGRKELSIPAKTSEIIQADFSRLVEGGLVAGNSPLSCGVVSDGPFDALRPDGSVTGTQYAAPIRFYDPETFTFTSLTAVGVDTSAKTHLSVHNVTDAPVDITPLVSEAVLNDPRTIVLTKMVLAPHGSLEINADPSLRAFQKLGINHATLTLRTEAPKGSLVGSLTQISSPNLLVEDIPLRTSNPPAFARGSYPLRWDQDYTNFVSVTNTAEETLRIGGEITAGDVVYVLTRASVKPGATITFDVDRWRRDGTPDVNGQRLPQDVAYGKFHWTELSNGRKAGLLGRTSMSSLSNRRKSSFSCGSTCEYNYLRYSYFDLGLDTEIIQPGAQLSQLTEYDSLLNGSSYTYPQSYYGDVESGASDIVSIAAGSDGTSVMLSSVSAGSTQVSNFFFSTDYTYDPENEECDQTQTQSEQDSNVSVTDTTPVLTGIDPGLWLSGTTTPGVVFTGEYFGTNAPSLSFSDPGISYTLSAFSDTQITADIYVPSGTPSENVSVSVISNGYNGVGFMSTAGLSAKSDPVKAVVQAPINSPEVTVVAWVDGSAPDLQTLPTGANSSLVYDLNHNPGTCNNLISEWSVNRNPKDLYSQSDRDYANAFLVANSANAQPPDSITPDSQFKAGDFRLFNDYGSANARYGVGATPDPCHTIFAVFQSYLGKGEASKNMGSSGTSGSGKTYLLAEGRVGKLGQRGSETVNMGRTVPFIFSVIEFDSSGNPFVSDHSSFPTFYVYINGTLHPELTYHQSDVKSFVYNYDATNESSYSPIP